MPAFTHQHFQSGEALNREGNKCALLACMGPSARLSYVIAMTRHCFRILGHPARPGSRLGRPGSRRRCLNLVQFCEGRPCASGASKLVFAIDHETTNASELG